MSEDEEETPLEPEFSKPEDVDDGIKHGETTIVIHPGSLHLRLGRASDPLPAMLPHCIAWRSRNSSYSRVTPWIKRSETEHSESIRMVLTAAEEAQKQLGDLQSSRGKFRQPTSTDQLADLNDEVEAEETDDVSQLVWTDLSLEKPDYIIGDDALYLSPNSGYHIIWPISYGELNIKKSRGYTVNNIMESLQVLWSSAIHKYLGVEKADLEGYNCILLIPDIFNRAHIRCMMEVVLERMGFSSVFPMQESVCAGFGMGLSSVCVVDMGDHKTSVTCVEDGISLEPSRITLRYGGRDITRTFSWLLDHIAFPYIDCQPDDNVLDALLLQELKHSYCHMDTDGAGTEEIHFQVRPPGKKITKYSMHVGDERIVATLAVFWPEMFGLKGSNLLLNGAYKDNDPTDVFDSDYILQTRSKQEESARLAAIKRKEQAVSQDDPLADDSQRDIDEDMMDTLADDMPSNKSEHGQPNAKKSGREDKIKSDQLLALDQAILSSIEQCENEEIKRKMYSNILLVGGGLLFEGVESLLQYRLWLHLPPHLKQSVNITVLSRTKDIDPQSICWKGGAILSVLDIVGDQWISKEEWLKYGSKIVREKVLFAW
ncbi:actin-related protein 8-like [Watersipora subatra]|uniref:actin-related protein 8-like n=1 Tax=Watersipora subatra TaxID=2589382 RepID=UPI00355AEE93